MVLSDMLRFVKFNNAIYWETDIFIPVTEIKDTIGDYLGETSYIDIQTQYIFLMHSQLIIKLKKHNAFFFIIIYNEYLIQRTCFLEVFLCR